MQDDVTHKSRPHTRYFKCGDDLASVQIQSSSYLKPARLVQAIVGKWLQVLFIYRHKILEISWNECCVIEGFVEVPMEVHFEIIS